EPTVTSGPIVLGPPAVDVPLGLGPPLTPPVQAAIAEAPSTVNKLSDCCSRAVTSPMTLLLAPRLRAHRKFLPEEKRHFYYSSVSGWSRFHSGCSRHSLVMRQRIPAPHPAQGIRKIIARPRP